MTFIKKKSQSNSKKLIETTHRSPKIQATIFPNEISPDQVDSGIETNNPQNFIAYHNEKPVGIVGFYTLENLPNHVLLNWYGVLPNERRQGYGRQILSLAIEKAKVLYQNVDYLTYYTSKSHNKEAIILYNNIGFTTKDYIAFQDNYPVHLYTIYHYFSNLHQLQNDKVHAMHI